MENAAAATDPRNGSTIKPDVPVGRDVEEELPLDVHSMVPNLNLDQTETQLITAEVRNKAYQKAAHISAPDIRSTPIDEAARTQRIFAMAFPTLYPWGDADPNSPRQRSVNLREYGQHMIKYKDGRFGSHPRWRFLVFNMIMREEVRKRARLFAASSLKRFSNRTLIWRITGIVSSSRCAVPVSSTVCSGSNGPHLY